MTRLDADGTVDTTFGTDGVVTLSEPNDTFDAGAAVAIQPDGKIIVVGNASPNANLATGAVVVDRLDADGSPDASFGTNGSVEFPFGPGTTISYSSAKVVAVQSDGKIEVGGLRHDHHP